MVTVIFTDYAHRNFGITDKNKTFSEKLNIYNLKKIKVYWNAGLMNHSFLTLQNIFSFL